MMRVIKGLAAMLVLIIGVIGVPAFLALVVGNPLPGAVSWTQLVAALTQPDDGSVLVALVSVVAWAAWLVFAVSTVIEVIAVLSRQRLRLRVPGLAAPQQLVSGLVLAVIALSSAPQISHADPVRLVPQASPRTADHAAELGAPSTTSRPETAAVRPERAPVVPPSAESAPRYTVQDGDDLWSLAERFYGQGRDWRRIAAANPDVLTGGPDRLETGWQLRIPGGDVGRPDGYPVQRGDTLSAIAERLLGDADRWPELYAANRSQLDDPDELPVGAHLDIPRETQTKPASVDHTDRAADRAERQPAAGDRAGDTPDHADPTPGPADRYPTTDRGDRTGGRTDRTTTGEQGETGVPSGRPIDRDPDALPKPVPEASSVDPRRDYSSGAPSAESTAVGVPRVPQQPVDATSPPAAESQPAVAESVPAVVAGIAGVGGLLAAGVVAGARSRRRAQLQSRPLGRRIAQPSPAAQLAETHLGRRQRPMGLRTLDLATRAIAAHSHRLRVEPPQIALVSVTEDRLDVRLTAESRSAPDGFQVAGTRWRLDGADVDRLRSTPGLTDAVRPYPALVTLGVSEDDAQVVADLEALQLTSIESSDPTLVDEALAAIAIELSCSPWAEELELILLGTCERLPDALGRHTVTRVDDLDEVLVRLSDRARSQRALAGGDSVAAQRVDPDRADAWTPTVLVVNRALSRLDQLRLRRVVIAHPPVSIAVVGVDLADAPCRIRLARGADAPTARVEPYGVTVVPQLLTAPAADAVIDLVEATGRTDTTPAPWWFDDESEAEPDPPDNVTYLGRRFGGWARSRSHDADRDDQEGAPMNRMDLTAAAGTSPHPVLRMLGPVDLVGAAGPTPPRAAKQCLEYCGWLLEHPGTSAQEMALALAVAEGTRRSNMSRLRGWLGADDDGQPYLPDAYSGRILLHPSVSSDWQRLQILTGRGVNLTSTGGLEAALKLVRGAPLADAAPGQWHWAEGLRTDMISVVRDIGVELAERALGTSDVELARWAATRALVVAPGDELLLVARIRTEHRAGNDAEVERLTLQLAAHARALEVDLRPETVDVLQEMMEGRVRARLA